MVKAELKWEEYDEYEDSWALGQKSNDTRRVLVPKNAGYSRNRKRKQHHTRAQWRYSRKGGNHLIQRWDH